MSTRFVDQGIKIKASVAQRIGQIAADTDLTEEARYRRIRAEKEAANKERAELREQQLAEDAEAQESERKRRITSAFGLAHLASALPSEIQRDKDSYRTALDLADNYADEDAAVRKLSRALDLGDTLLALAIARVSYERGWRRALEQYAQAEPSKGEKIRELIVFEVGRNQPHRGQQFERLKAYSDAFAPLPESPGERQVRLRDVAAANEDRRLKIKG